jgi:uncharacterized protein (DUF1800 family)
MREDGMANPDRIHETFLGQARFGLGRRIGDVPEIDIRSALLAEIGKPAPMLDDLPDSSQALAAIGGYKRQRKQLAQSTPDGMDGAGDAAMLPQGKQNKMSGRQREIIDAIGTPPQQQIFRAEAAAHFEQAIQSPLGFAERMVWFWSNHFCVSVRKGALLRGLAGIYEREAIRPHLFGRFSDMLLAATQHPAMLDYLDNRRSTGARSPAGQRQKRGLNENHAREILELHTLGVDGGYSQADVTALANILTGWTFDQGENQDGAFRFARRRHEPGPKSLLGKTYRQQGKAQGLAALSDIARHPATARHIATKLARHFLADAAPQSLIDRLERSFRSTGGDLAALAKVLLTSEESWSPERGKLRNPQEFLIASYRALAIPTDDTGRMIRWLEALGQPLWQPSGPNGFADNEGTWANAEGFKTRLDVADRLARLAALSLNPSEALEQLIGPFASRETRQVIAHAESPAQGFALLLMSPEFQRR